MKNTFLLLFCILSNHAFSQNVLDNEVSEQLGTPVYRRVENMPEFLISQQVFSKFIYDNLKYPQASLKNRVYGTVVVGFIVNEDSSVSDFHIRQGINPELNKEAIRLVSMIRRIKPGNIDGKNVKVLLAQPIKFSISSFELEQHKYDSLVSNGRPYYCIEADSPSYSYQVVEQMAGFPGGVKAMMTFIKDKIKYKQYKKITKAGGQVIVRFLVNDDGSTSSVTVWRGINEKMDSAVVRAIELLPKFRPVKENGKTVRVTITLPIIFKANNVGQPAHIPEIKPSEPYLFPYPLPVKK